MSIHFARQTKTSMRMRVRPQGASAMRWTQHGWYVVVSICKLPEPPSIREPSKECVGAHNLPSKPRPRRRCRVWPQGASAMRWTRHRVAIFDRRACATMPPSNREPSKECYHNLPDKPRPRRGCQVWLQGVSDAVDPARVARFQRCAGSGRMSLCAGLPTS